MWLLEGGKVRLGLRELERIFEVERRKCFPSRNYDMDKEREEGMRKVGKGLENKNQRVYVGVKWWSAGMCVRVQPRQGLGNWVEALWTGCGWWKVENHNRFLSHRDTVQVRTSLGLHWKTHRSSEEVLWAHSQDRAKVLRWGDGLPNQGEVEAQDDGIHHVLHTVLRENGLSRTHYPSRYFPPLALLPNCIHFLLLGQHSVPVWSQVLWPQHSSLRPQYPNPFHSLNKEQRCQRLTLDSFSPSLSQNPKSLLAKAV